MRAFIIFALIACAYADYVIRTGHDLDTYRDLCSKELHLSEDSVAHYKQWKFEDDTSAAYLHCVFKHMDLYDDTNGFHLANIETQVGGHHDEIKSCADSSHDDDHNQEVFKGFKCFAKSNLKLIRGSIHHD